MTDKEIVLNFKLIQEQLNSVVTQMNNFAKMLHKENSDAIDSIVVSLLNQSDDGGTTDV